MADEIKTLFDEFVDARTSTPTTHEEWLLRICATLMEREAQLVSVSGHPNNPNVSWKRNTLNLATFTKPSMATADASLAGSSNR